MNIGIIGSGMIGGTTARLFARNGHSVVISNRRGPASIAGLVAEIGSNACAASVEDAAKSAEVVLIAIPFGEYRDVPAKPLAGKIVVDAMNYYQQRDGRIDFGGLSSTELVARRLVDARLVKAFNTMYFQTLASEGRTDKPIEERLALFIAGDNEEAKAVIARLIEEIGFAPIDTGGLHDGGLLQQPGSRIYNRPMTAPEARTALASTR